MSFLGLVAGLGAQSLTIYTEELPPAAFHDSSGKARGWAIDLVSDLQRRVGNSTPIHFVPWARAYAESIHNPDVLVFTMVRTPEREPLFNWIGPISRAHVVLLGAKGRALRIKDLQDAKGLSIIGSVRQDAKETMVRNLGFTNLESATSIEQNYLKLKSGRIEAMIVSSMFWRIQATEIGLDPDDFTELLPLSEDVVSYLAFSKGTDPSIVAAWSRAFDGQKADGSLARIYATWRLGSLP